MGLYDEFKNMNAGTEEEKRIAQEIIDTYLSQKRDVNGELKWYYDALNKTGRDIISNMISHEEDEDKVLKVLEVVDDVNKEDKDGNSYLSFACLQRRVKVIELLLKKGANPNHKNKRGATPILHALGRKSPKCPEILQLFIKYGVDLNMEVNGSAIEDTIRMFEDKELNAILDNNK